jgi:trk system potassium uptake protein TrkA
MKIVIAGQIETPIRVAAALMHDHEVILICPRGTRDPQIEKLDVAPVLGPATSPDVLSQADVAKADLFIAATAVDEANLVACVMAKQLGARRTICFLFRRDIHGRGEAVISFTDALGIDLVIRPAEQLAEEILRIVSVPGALDLESFAGGQVSLVRRAVEADTPVTREPLKDLAIPPGVVLVMAKRGDEMFIPGGLTRFEPGDKVTAMGEPKALDRLAALFRSREREKRGRTATVVGGGVVGTAVTLGLERAGWRVRLIERDAERCKEVAETVRSLVLHGDGSDLDLLEQEQVAQDSVLVAVTSNDEKNLLVSLLAKQIGVPRIITRADIEANERLFERVGVDVVLSARGAAINTVLRAAVTGRTDMLAELEHGDAEVLELEVPPQIEPIAIAKLRRPIKAIIGGIVRGGKVIIPRGSDQVRGGDHLLVLCMRDEEEQARSYFANFMAKG